MNRLYLWVSGFALIVFGGWLGFSFAARIYSPDKERLQQIITAEYLRDWSSYTNLPTIKPDDCTVRRGSSEERRTNVYFVGTCQSDVDGEPITFEVRLNEVGRVERFEMQP